MENQIETKPIESFSPSEPLVVPVPHSRRSGDSRKVIFFVALIIIVLIVVALVVWKTSKPQSATKTLSVNPTVNPTSVTPTVSPKTGTVSSLNAANSAGVILPTDGFPADLVIEPEVKPTVNKTEYSNNGKVLTATREYKSRDRIYTAYQIAYDYLSKKNWTVTPVIAPNDSSGPQDQTVLEFTASKDGYNADLKFKYADFWSADVTIIVKSGVN